jgi:hypothetical protein
MWRGKLVLRSNVGAADGGIFICGLLGVRMRRGNEALRGKLRRRGRGGLEAWLIEQFLMWREGV